MQTIITQQERASLLCSLRTPQGLSDAVRFIGLNITLSTHWLAEAFEACGGRPCLVHIEDERIHVLPIPRCGLGPRVEAARRLRLCELIAASRFASDMAHYDRISGFSITRSAALAAADITFEAMGLGAAPAPSANPQIGYVRLAWAFCALGTEDAMALVDVLRGPAMREYGCHAQGVS